MARAGSWDHQCNGAVESTLKPVDDMVFYKYAKPSYAIGSLEQIRGYQVIAFQREACVQPHVQKSLVIVYSQEFYAMTEQLLRLNWDPELPLDC